MPGSFRIGKIAGIDIDIHVSWIIILVLLTVSLAIGWFPQLYTGQSTATYWIVSLIASLLLFVSVLFHELTHSLVARRRGFVHHLAPIISVLRDTSRTLERNQ
jgi:Zn-dependent protease